MSKNHKVTINNFPGGTSAMILENINQLVKSKADCLIVRTGTNDLSNGKNLLNQAKKKNSDASQKSFPKYQNCIFEHYNPERP